MSVCSSPETSERVRALAAVSHGLIARVLDEIGPRESCGEGERQLGRLLLERWRALGLDVRAERFRCHPRAFLGFIPVMAVLYLVAVASFWRWPWLCVIASATALSLTVFELLRYQEFIDPLFASAEGENVLGVVAPAGELQRRVVVSAHLDAAYEFNLWFTFRQLAVPIMAVGMSAPAVSLAAGTLRALGGGGFESLGWVCFALSPVVGLHLFFHTFAVVPGAMDDLAGISVLDGVARALAEAQGEGARLGSTEVVLLATSAEEAGLRGAKRFVDAHRAELHATPTFGLFVDGVYDERYLTVIDREITSGVRNDPRLVALALSAAEGRNRKMLRAAIPLGHSDAAPFTLAGIPSVTLLCHDTSRLAPNYHTRRDTLDKVRPESIETMLQLVLDLLDRIDGAEIDADQGVAA